MVTASEGERRSVAHQLRAYLQLQSRSEEQIQGYVDKVLSGSHDIWTLQLAVALRDEHKDIFAGLEDDAKPQAKPTDRPDVRTLLLMQDENERVASIPSREGKPRVASSAESIHKRLHEKAKNSSTAKDVRHFVAIREPYPPCTVQADKLKAINLADLKQETHHRGSVIHIRRCGPLVRDGIALACAVEDDAGDVESLELHHLDTSYAEYLLQSDVFVSIKEPYYTVALDGEAVIRVDHPSDLMGFHKRTQPQPERTAAEWKQAGNDYLTQKQLWLAREAYMQGLANVTEQDGRLKLDLSRNLARVDLELGLYPEAHRAAVRAISDPADPALTSLDVKACFRAASATYNVKQYGEAQSYIDRLLGLDSNDIDGKRESHRVRSRLEEQANGLYEFDKAISMLSAQNPRVDVAGFCQRVQTKESPVGGRGLFAACDLGIGDLVLVEKAFCSVFEKDPKWYGAWEYNNGRLSMASSTMALWDEIMLSLQRDPPIISAVTALRGDYAGLGTQEVEGDGELLADAFQIRSIIESNAFGVPTPTKRQRTKPFGFTAEHQEQTQLGDNTGIFLMTAMMNHSCVPNTRKYFVGDAIIIRATRPIKEGEELLQSYAQTDADVGERRQMLESTWHFKCNCKLCTVEEKEAEEKRKSRDTLERRANSLGMAIKNAAASTTEVAKADVLLKSLKSSYDPELYRGLPRKASAYLHLGLIQHYMRNNQRSRCMMTLTSLFDQLGWNLTMTNEKTELTNKDDSETHIVPELVDALLIARSMLRRAGGKGKQAEELEKIAKKVYLAVNGVENGWEQLVKNKE